MDTLNDLFLLGKILLAIVLSGVVGYERERAGKAAGLRTHMLVAASATLIVSLGPVLANSFTTTERTQIDPLRLIEAVIVGVSFLGTGTILQRQSDMRVEGLTTAASLLFTAGVGIAIAVDEVLLAIGSVIIILGVTWGVGKLSQSIGPHSSE